MSNRADDPEHKYEVERERVANSDLSDADKRAILDFISAFDENDLSESYRNGDGETETLSYNSLENYSRAMRLIAKESDRDLLEHDLDSLTVIFNTFLEDLSKYTVRQRQAAAIKFYRFHETGIDPDEIPLQKTEKGSSVDERDMFTKEEIHQLREACKNPRDRCLLELLVYTGQRIRALQTLRLKDIDLDEGVYYLNTDEAGLKGADKTGSKRPLLGAEKAVRDWIDQHPTGNQEDYLISPLHSATNTEGDGRYLSLPAIRQQLWNLAERAGVYNKETGEGKSPNPHNFRHYFVTVCYREYDMDPSTIKFLIGHTQDSTVMETTYQHLTDEDHINAARRHADSGRDPEEKEGALTPETCPTCKENLPPAAKACPNCGQVFTPDAQSTKQKLDTDVKDSYKQTHPEDTDTQEKIDQLDDLLDDPDVKAALLEKLNE
jgi:integrase/recombinase XerD